jgi:hypothetical protein
LGTWSGPGWTKDKSTLLQVLVSIQGLILVSDPWYNEPGYENRKDARSKQEAKLYSNRIRMHTLQHAIDDYLDVILQKRTLDYPEFQSVMIQHYCQRAQAIFVMMDEWIANDPLIKPLADKIRPKLLQLVQEHGTDGNGGALVDDGDRKPAALKKVPEVYEIDD